MSMADSKTENINLVIRIIDSGIDITLPHQRNTNPVHQNFAFIANARLRKIFGTDDIPRVKPTDKIIWDPPTIDRDTRFCDFTAEQEAITAIITLNLGTPSLMTRLQTLQTLASKENVRVEPQAAAKKAAHKHEPTAVSSQDLQTILDRIDVIDRELKDSKQRSVALVARNKELDKELAASKEHSEALAIRNDELATRHGELAIRNKEIDRELAASKERSEALAIRNDELAICNDKFGIRNSGLDLRMFTLETEVEALKHRYLKLDTSNEMLKREIDDLKADVVKLTDDSATLTLEVSEAKAKLAEEGVRVSELEHIVIPLHSYILIEEARKRLISLFTEFKTWPSLADKYPTPGALFNHLSRQRLDPLCEEDLDFLYDPGVVRIHCNETAHSAGPDDLRRVVEAETNRSRRARWDRIFIFTFPDRY